MSAAPTKNRSGTYLRDVVICQPVRTPIGRYGGALQSLTAAELGTVALRALLERSGIDPLHIGDVILGHAYGSGEAPAIGRVVALDAGLPASVPGRHVDRRCGSGLQAVMDAAMQVQTGVHQAVVAGGVESMSNAIFYSTDIRWGGSRTGVTMHDSIVRGRTTAGGKLHPVPGGMLETAENLRREFSISREDQDALALSSHQRAVAAQATGAFGDELVPVTIKERGGTRIVDVDEHPRADTTIEGLARLKPILIKTDPEATVTAGNSSGQNDAGAMCLVADRAFAESHGLEPRMRLVDWAVSGCEPHRMGVGPVAATETALGRAGLTLADMDVIELNEAFASQVLAVTRLWNFGDADHERVNVRGSGISLGHPVGATAIRMLASLAGELHQRDGRYGLATMCVGGGQGMSAVFERID